MKVGGPRTGPPFGSHLQSNLDRAAFPYVGPGLRRRRARQRPNMLALELQVTSRPASCRYPALRTINSCRTCTILPQRTSQRLPYRTRAPVGYKRPNPQPAPRLAGDRTTVASPVADAVRLRRDRVAPPADAREHGRGYEGAIGDPPLALIQRPFIGGVPSGSFRYLPRIASRCREDQVGPRATTGLCTESQGPTLRGR